MSKSFSTAEVSKHKTPENGLWIIIDGGVYDVTKFIDEHPGGPKILKRVGGKDASKPFWKVRSTALAAFLMYLPLVRWRSGLYFCSFFGRELPVV